MRHIVVLLWLVSALFSYEKGANVDSNLLKEMGMQEGKIYILDFFASWCASCKKEIPDISQANRRFDKTKVEIIGIDVDTDVTKGKDFQAALLSKNHLNFRVINDADNHIVKAFNPKAMPAIFYIKNRKVEKVIYGAIDGIDEILTEDIKMMGL